MNTLAQVRAASTSTVNGLAPLIPASELPAWVEVSEPEFLALAGQDNDGLAAAAIWDEGTPGGVLRNQTAWWVGGYDRTPRGYAGGAFWGRVRAGRVPPYPRAVDVTAAEVVAVAHKLAAPTTYWVYRPVAG